MPSNHFNNFATHTTNVGILPQPHPGATFGAGSKN